MSAPAGILDGFAKILSIITRKERDERTPLLYALQALEEFKAKLEEIRKRLKDRVVDLTSAATRAIENNDRNKAVVYAQEIAQVKKMLKCVNVVSLALEKAIERLKTLHVFNDLKGLGAVIGLLQELKAKYAEELPIIARVVDDIVSNVNQLAAATQSPVVMHNVATVDKEVEEILREIEQQAEIEVRNITSRISPIVNKLVDDAEKRSMVPRIPRVIEPQPVPTVVLTSFDERRMLKNLVFEYIVEHNGLVDLNDIAKKLGVSKDKVMEALLELQREGKIKISM